MIAELDANSTDVWDNILEINYDIRNAKKDDDTDDDDDTEVEEEDDQWEKSEEEEENWDPDFDEFDMPKSGKKGGKGDKYEDDDDYKIDDEFKDLFSGSSNNLDDEDDDY